MEPKFLGKNTRGPSTELDVIPSPGIDRVVMTSDEVISNCPVTGQPDHYTVTIDYRPDRLCIESKSLKLYFWHFRDRQIFCEGLAVEIRDKVTAVLQPKSVHVTVVQKARGGITIRAESMSGANL